MRRGGELEGGEGKKGLEGGGSKALEGKERKGGGGLGAFSPA